MEDTNNPSLETEPYGVLYERFALQRLFARLTKRYSIRSVLEIPAVGAKAAPGLYSVGWALAGATVTLVNADPAAKAWWDELGLSDQVEFIHVDDLASTDPPDDGHDLVWNFNVLPAAADWEKRLREMHRLAKKHVMLVHVNALNVGFPFHRLAHKLTGIPWSHGDVRLNNPFRLKSMLRSMGKSVRETGVVDCPCWPDSLGFRDIRVHRTEKEADEVRWESEYLRWAREDRFPAWVKWVRMLERVPLPTVMKYPYAHLFYMILGRL